MVILRSKKDMDQLRKDKLLLLLSALFAFSMIFIAPRIVGKDALDQMLLLLMYFAPFVMLFFAKKIKAINNIDRGDF